MRTRFLHRCRLAKGELKDGQVASKSAIYAAPFFSITAVDFRSLLRKELFPDLLEAVISECFYRNPGATGTGPPIETFGGDGLG